MTGLMLSAFAYQLTGNLAHEVIGIVIIVLFIAHHLLNLHWYKTLRKRIFVARQVLSVSVNLLLFVAMVFLTISSIMISRDLLAFLHINGGFAVRQLHTLASYWILIFISVHLGLHWNMVLGAARKMSGLARPNRIRNLVYRILAILVATYGIKASLDMNIGSKLVLFYTFDYWDFEKSSAAFFINYLSIMALYVCVTYYAMKWMQKSRKATGEIQNEK